MQNSCEKLFKVCHVKSFLRSSTIKLNAVNSKQQRSPCWYTVTSRGETRIADGATWDIPGLVCTASLHIKVDIRGSRKIAIWAIAH